MQVLARLESKVKELSDEVEVLKNKKDYNLPLRVTELEKKALSTKGKKDHDLYVRVEELEKKSTNKQTNFTLFRYILLYNYFLYLLI